MDRLQAAGFLRQFSRSGVIAADSNGIEALHLDGRQRNGHNTSVTSEYFKTRARFLKANQEIFTDWGEADNHQITGAALDEFRSLFVVTSSYYQRLGWVSKPKPVWYRREQLSRDAVDRWLGRTPYGKIFSKLDTST